MIKLAGTWTFTQGSATAVGVDTQALTAVFVGDAISINRENWYRVLTIASDTSITFEPAFVETTAAGAQGWLFPVATTRPTFGSLSAQFTDLRNRYSEVMVVSGADRRITLNKTASTDFSEIIHQAGGVNKFKTGLIADNEWALMAFINGAWANVLKTVTTGVSPSQAVSLAYGLVIGVGVGTVALPGMSFVGRPDTGLWSPAAATLAASAGGVEVWRSTASLITLAQNVKLSKASPTFDINATAAEQARILRAYTNDVLRWQMYLGDSAAEAGGNAGSDFYLLAHNDAGTSIGSALVVKRSSMLATFGAGIVVTDGAINAVGAGTLTIGGVSTGNITIGRSQAGTVIIPYTTAATSTVIGAVTIAGGLGVAGAGWFGGLNVVGAAAAINIDATSGAVGINFKRSGTVQSIIFDDGAAIFVASASAGSPGVTMAHGGNSWAAYSDARADWKKTARPISILDRIDKFALYENTVNGRPEIFVKAQEFYHVLPHLVNVGDDDPNYTPTGMRDPRAWTVMYDRAGIAALQVAKEIYFAHRGLADRVTALEAHHAA